VETGLGLELVIVGALETNCYIVYCRETLECALIDPGAEAERIFSAVTALKLRPTLLLNTHGHIDHTGANRDITERYGVPFRIHAGDLELLQSTDYVELSLMLGARQSPAPDSFLNEGDEVAVGRQSLRVIHTPGHTPGSVSLYGNGLLFSGDTLFCGGFGRTDLPGGSWKDLKRSIEEHIMVLPEETVVLPGHGPRTTIGEEKLSNPVFA
jgi:glyoxylase-like metal-dependent hydrolase (beta-lactamase superfamily II)